MDLEDWEYLPDADSYLIRDYDGGVAASRSVRSTSAESVLFNMDHFSIDKLLIPSPQFVPFQFRSPTIQAEEIVQRLLHDTASQHQFQDTTPDSASQVFFKKSFSKEANEFVDMMLLNFSPKSSSANKVANLIGNFRFDENTADDDLITTISPRNKNKFDLFNEVEIARNLTLIKSDDPHQLAKNDVNWIGEGIIGDDYAIDEDGGLNFWKLGFGGIGAICSFGVAAAAICLLMFSNKHKAKKDHKLRFQIFAADDQRMKQDVQQATKFNVTMLAAARGPSNRAQITYGSYL
ncbi:unnamed protein product [Rhodiola kirilowii]